jgi:hypothetical protein
LGPTGPTGSFNAFGYVSVLDFGADPTGAIDSSAAFQSAINSLAPLGGTVVVPPGNYLITSSVYVGIRSTSPIGPTTPLVANVYLVGPTPAAVQSLETSQYFLYANITLSSSASFVLGGMSGVDGLRIFRQGLTFTRTAPASYAGTAVYGAGGQEVSVKNCFILGFSQAVHLLNCPGSTVDSVYFDCTNGILVDYSLDVTRVMNCHGFPWVTDGVKLTAADNNRSGYAYRFLTHNDWTEVINCFSYGYFRGFFVDTYATIQFVACGSDNTQQHPSSAGFVVGNLSANGSVHLIGCLSAATQNNFYMDANVGVVLMDNCESWGAQNGSGVGNGFVNASGVTFINNTYIHDNVVGYQVTGGTVYGSGVALRGNGTTGSGFINAMPTTVSV